MNDSDRVAAQEMKKIRRRDRLPSVFCAFPWVRPTIESFADCGTEEDRRLVSLHIGMLAGEVDVSVLDDEFSVKLAIDIPEVVREADGRSGRGLHARIYHWKFHDVNYLLKGEMPSEAVPVSEAGFFEDDLIALGTAEDFLTWIRLHERFLGEPKGYRFPVALEEKFRDFQSKNLARVKLRQKQLGLRLSGGGRSARGDPPSVPESMRNEVLKDHDYRCLFCGRGRPEFRIDVHHVFPRRLIERLDLPERLFTARENLVACCAGCNVAKSDEVSKEDVRFYLCQFARVDHANNRLVSALELLRKLQDGCVG
jgi:hypothetical protein